MALLTGLDSINAAADTFSDWLVRTNELSELMVNDVVTANSSGANTDGDAILNGSFVANTIVAADEIRGGDLSTNGALTISTNASFSADVSVTGNLDVTDTVTIANGNLDYILDSTNFIDLIPSTSGDSLGNTTNQWLLFATDIDASGNVDVGDTLTVDTLAVTNTATFPALDFTEDVTFVDVAVSGNATFVDIVANGQVTASGVTTDSITASANLSITPNTDFSANVTIADDLTVDGTVTINTLSYTLVPDNYNDLVPNQVSGRSLGNTTNRWDGFFIDIDVSGNTSIDDTLTVDTLTVTNTATFPALDFTENVTFVNVDVSGNASFIDIVANGQVTASDVVTDSITATANLSVNSNTDFSANVTVADDLTVDGTLTITTLSYTLVPDDYNDLIPNQVSGRSLGNTVNRWDGFFTDIDVSGNVSIDDTLTVDTLSVTNTASFGDVTFSGLTTFNDIDVSGNATINSLSVSELTTNQAALIGNNSTVTSTGATVIDSFDKTLTKGFKYVIHGDNNEATSAYAIEINCSHNGTSVFYTRFGEVSNNFDAVVEPQVNGANIELVATCSSGSVSNTHNFNLVRIETRNG